MHVRRLLSLAAAFAASATWVSVLEGQTSSVPPPVSFGGVVYAQWMYQDFPIGGVRVNSFDVKRAYVNLIGRFSILLPGTPQEAKQSVQTPGGAVELHLFAIELKNNAGAYILAFADYPAATVKEKGAEQLLTESRQAMLANTPGAKLAGEKKITFDGHPGREVSIETSKPQPGIMRDKMYLVGNRLYQIMIAGPKEKVESREADKVFDSFKVTQK